MPVRVDVAQCGSALEDWLGGESRGTPSSLLSKRQRLLSRRSRCARSWFRPQKSTPGTTTSRCSTRSLSRSWHRDDGSAFVCRGRGVAQLPFALVRSFMYTRARPTLGWGDGAATRHPQATIPADSVRVWAESAPKA
jgi:hypothetical protein